MSPHPGTVSLCLSSSSFIKTTQQVHREPGTFNQPAPKGQSIQRIYCCLHSISHKLKVKVYKMDPGIPRCLFQNESDLSFSTFPLPHNKWGLLLPKWTALAYSKYRIYFPGLSHHAYSKPHFHELSFKLICAVLSNQLWITLAVSGVKLVWEP